MALRNTEKHGKHKIRLCPSFMANEGPGNKTHEITSYQTHEIKPCPASMENEYHHEYHHMDQTMSNVQTLSVLHPWPTKENTT